MSSPADLPPPVESLPLDEADTRLDALWDKIEEGQLDFLDAAGKRIIEVGSVLQAVFLAILAFGKDFPPAYLQGQPTAQALAVLAVLMYFGAIGAALVSLQPRDYSLYRHNLTAKRRELDNILKHKGRWVRIAGGLFGLGALALALLIATLVLRR